MTKSVIRAAVLIAASALALSASTIEVTASLPAYNGTYDSTGPFPLPAVEVGDMTYSVPGGDTIESATLTGTFGNAEFPGTAAVYLYANGILVGDCAAGANCNTTSTGPVTPFTFDFPTADFSMLASGSLEITAVQTTGNIIRLGAETLTICADSVGTQSQVPEPGSFLLLSAGVALLGFGAVIGVLRRRVRGRSAESETV